MLKLIPDGSTAPAPIVTTPVVIDTHPVSDYQVSVIATAPDSQPIAWSIPLSWKLSGMVRPDLRMSAGVKAWVKYSTLFSNWLYTSVTAFLAADIDELTIPVPDQFIDDMDVTTLTFSREYEKAGYSYIKIYC